MDHDYALSAAFPELAARLPRLELGRWPTPLAHAGRMEAAAGLPFKLFVKRDDLSSAVYGGNKVRKLELILAQAQAAGKKMIVTSGGLGSNHVVATAALSASAGMRTTGLLFCQPVTAHVRRNLLADVALGADLVWVRDYPGVVLGYIGALWRGLIHDGRLPYILMPGGSNALSSAGYASAVFEMLDQFQKAGEKEPAAIFVPGGTGGTAAGVLAGVALAGVRTSVVAVRVVAPGLLGEPKIRKLAAATLRLLSRLDPAVSARLRETGALAELAQPGAGGRFVLEGGFLGEAYGFATEEGRRAVDLAAETESLKLETTYTGKTLAALLSWGGSDRGARAETQPGWLDRAKARHPVVFLNTYSSSDPAGVALGTPPPADLAGIPPALRWCFDRSKRDCRCALRSQCHSFCEVVQSTDGWDWS